MFVIWLVQSHVCTDVHFNGILFIKRGGWFTGSRFLDISMENVSEGLKSTNQSLAQLLICFKSLLSTTAAVFGFSTIVYRFVSSAKSLTEALSLLTISLI